MGMNSYSADAGTSVEIVYAFDTVNSVPGFPIVALIDDAQQIVAEFPATISIVNSDEWSSTIVIPDVDANTQVLWTVCWTFNTGEQTTVVNVPLYVNPNIDNQTGDIVLLPGQPLSFNMKRVVTVADIMIYQNNDLVQLFHVSGAPNIVNAYCSTAVRVDINISPSITPYLVVVDQLIFNLWVVTPRILTACLALESWINKAHIEQVIPQLEYKQSDLLNYLERGLNLFNGYPPQLMTFNGLNMQGPLYETWLLCATYYALGAQLQAEGALSFDFSGQAVTLNVDRTGSIESALGRVESMIGDKVPALKKLLAKYGINSGDGSNIYANSNSIGRVGITHGAFTVGNARNFGPIQMARHR